MLYLFPNTWNLMHCILVQGITVFNFVHNYIYILKEWISEKVMQSFGHSVIYIRKYEIVVFCDSNRLTAFIDCHENVVFLIKLQTKFLILSFITKKNTNRESSFKVDHHQLLKKLKIPKNTKKMLTITCTYLDSNVSMAILKYKIS